ncbi:diguanylate cyclase domain-containing protein [Clostridioides sp. ES-S-0108-01]|uniref:diguanylate cyclase domain-containing protein n=1 Tax=Clostridioides sp. ES-S-0108-01 TaxID=2770773 RepID=UPI001D0CD745
MIYYFELYHHADSALYRAKEEGKNTYCMKYINDIHGYEYGDKVLIIVATALSKTFNTKETCARVGSDNFVILAKYRDSLLDEISKILTEAIISELNMNVTQTIS